MCYNAFRGRAAFLRGSLILPPRTKSTKVEKPVVTQDKIDAASPLPVLVAAEQPPIPVMQVAPDGVTPVPIPSLGPEANTPPGESTPISQGVPTPPNPVPPIEPTGTPVNMTVVAPSPPPATVTKGEGTTLTPTTTEEEDVASESRRQAQIAMTEGQQLINKIWEVTQSRIALMVVASGVAINSVIVTAIVFLNKEVSVTQLALISISLQFINLTTGIVIGFYFSRTNHSARGGVGDKPSEPPYTGR